AKEYIAAHSNGQWQTGAEQQEFEALLLQLKAKATSLDPTLAASAEAALAKINKQPKVLEQKMLRAEKRKHDTELGRIDKLKTILFPNGTLQERVENFISYYPLYGRELIKLLIDDGEPLKSEFLVINF